MEMILLFATVLAPIIVGVTELTKKTLRFPKNYVPAVAFVIGILIGAIAYPFSDLDLVMRMWAGGLAGLSATGLFEIGNQRDGETK